MKVLGFLLLLAGWAIVFAAVPVLEDLAERLLTPETGRASATIR